MATPDGRKVVPAGNFEMTLADLSNINQPQMVEHNKEQLNEMGGVESLAKKLNVDLNVGLTSEESKLEFQERRNAFGCNFYPEPPAKGFWKLFIESFNDTILMILIVAAFVSLGVGLYQDPEKEWIEGTAILIAVLVVAFVTAANDYSKEKQFRALNAVKDDILVKVMRDGLQIQVSTKDLNVGEVVVLDTGDKIPCDGVFIEGDDVKSNESSLTGEPEDLTKSTEKDPFMLSGCQITSGFCKMLVIAVGSQSQWGQIKSKLAVEQEDTPLQQKLDDMAKFIGYIGTGAAISTFIAMFVVWFAKPAVQDQYANIGAYLIHAFIICITIIVVAIPEGLPLAVTISLAYSTKKMLKDNNLIRVLAACETMGNATNICSDKTGTLTENRMTVVEGWFAGQYYEQGRMPTKEQLSKNYLNMMFESMSQNSKAVVTMGDDGRPNVVGSKTEGALIMMVQAWGCDYLKIRETHFAKLFPFSSARKSMSVLVHRGDGYRLYVKGASEIILGRCTRVATPDPNEGQVVDMAEGSDGDEFTAMSDSTREELNNTILSMADKALRTIGIAHRDFKAGELPADVHELHESPESDLILDSIVGIIDPLRPDVNEAVKTCQAAGIMVRMVTGDNLRTAKAIARQCGILTEGGTAMEGPVFRKLSPEALDAVLPNLQVLARSSPADKHTLVTRLNGAALPKTEAEWKEVHPDRDWTTERHLVLPGHKEEWSAAHAWGEVVGVTGDGTNDAPALKAADVGLSMGISGTEVAKEASDIVIMDDRFSSIVKAVLWGRSVYDNIRKFLQFQLTVNIVALLITFLGAVSGFDPPLNAVMMLWVNLIMDTMGALALGTEPPQITLLDRKPYKRAAYLVSNIMWRNIWTQSLYQIALLLILLFSGPELLGVNPGGTCLEISDIRCEVKDYTHYTLIFNAFVWCQVFNEFNARSIGNDWNCFKGLLTNPMFCAVIVITTLLQMFIVEVGGDFTKTIHISAEQWMITVAMGFVAVPLGMIMRFLPPQVETASSFAGYGLPVPDEQPVAVVQVNSGSTGST